MRKVWILAAALLFAMSATAADLTVDEILAKNAEAKGGIEKLRALKSIRYSGTLSLGGGLEAPLVMIKKRPESMRMDFTFQGMTGTQAFDGTTAWAVMPFMGKKDPEAMTGDMLKEAKQQADFDGPFIDSEKKGYKVESLGKVDLAGTPAYKLKLRREGNDTFVYIDANSFLDIRTEAKRTVQGQEIESETTIGNYKEFEGLLIPTQIEMKTKGAPAGQTITIDKVEINPAVEDDAFAMPKKAEAAKP
ncbi:MAG TPA: hypothetical protein VE974_13635 [Thermoanaerobaculia bacterium]|nr:hypothetical protein [Thermoanaerobaculia bacterium]